MMHRKEMELICAVMFDVQGSN